MYTYMKDNLRKEEKILEILENMMSIAKRLNVRERLIVKRLAKKLGSSLGVWVTFTG